jgi:hypothetical protein
VVAANVAAAGKTVGHEFNEPADLLLGLQSLIEMGAREAIITRGGFRLRAFHRQEGACPRALGRYHRPDLGAATSKARNADFLAPACRGFFVRMRP